MITTEIDAIKNNNTIIKKFFTCKFTKLYQNAYQSFLCECTPIGLNPLHVHYTFMVGYWQAGGVEGVNNPQAHIEF